MLNNKTVDLKFKVDKGNTGIMILYEKGIEIGCLQFHLDLLVENPYIHLTWLLIEKKYRRKKYGSLLLSLLVSYAKIIDLPIKVNSLRESINFYKKFSFIKEEGYKNNENYNLVYYCGEKKKNRKLKII